MRYINQLDYPDIPYLTRTDLEGEEREKGLSTTVKSSACGLCSAIMVADRLLVNCEFGLEDALQLSYETRANRRVGTSYAIFAPAFAEKLGLRYEGTYDVARLLDCLRTGGAAVVLVRGDREDGSVGTFSNRGHYIAAIGQEPDGRIAILDPSYKEGKYEEEGRQGKVEVVHDRVALCDVAVLEEDAAKKSTPYWLFWRA